MTRAEPEDETPITGTYGAQRRMVAELRNVRHELAKARRQRLALGVLMLLWAALYVGRWVLVGN